MGVVDIFFQTPESEEFVLLFNHVFCDAVSFSLISSATRWLAARRASPSDGVTDVNIGAGQVFYFVGSKNRATGANSAKAMCCDQCE